MNFWVACFLVQWALLIVVYEYVLVRIRPITHGNEELHEKYPAFRRDDRDCFTKRPRYYIMLGTLVPRFLFGLVGVFVIGIGNVILWVTLPVS